MSIYWLLRYIDGKVKWDKEFPGRSSDMKGPIGGAWINLILGQYGPLR